MIRKLFGAPYKEHKLLHLFYWFSVVFYFLLLAVLLLTALATPDGIQWFLFFLTLVTFPFVFKSIYSINIHLQKKLYDSE
jgi:hypothetical protein